MDTGSVRERKGRFTALYRTWCIRQASRRILRPRQRAEDAFPGQEPAFAGQAEPSPAEARAPCRDREVKVACPLTPYLVRENLPFVETYEMVLEALGDRTRRQIVEILRRGPSSVGDIAARLPVSRPAISQHL